MNPLIIIGNRMTGKTTQLISAVKQDKNGLLVVWNMGMKQKIRAIFNLKDNKMITHSDLRNEKVLKGLKPSNLYVDDAEYFIGYNLGKHTLKGVVITLEDPRVVGTKHYKQNYE